MSPEYSKYIKKHNSMTLTHHAVALRLRKLLYPAASLDRAINFFRENGFPRRHFVPPRNDKFSVAVNILSLQELQTAAAGGRRRRTGISAAAPFAQTTVKGKRYLRQGVQGKATWQSACFQHQLSRSSPLPQSQSILTPRALAIRNSSPSQT